ncbi:MAG TPA: hypothetical protein VK511_01360 [Gemmatimonadaceae bacterium]|nr:hypothetical protein [Gemmatimonadaceae bacterium]
MKKFAMLVLCAVLTACGSDSSDNGPSTTFTGTWTGYALENMGEDTLYLSLTSSQTGSALSGTGTGTESGSSAPLTFTGTSTPPTLNLTIPLPVLTLTFSGVYVRSDSVSGTLSNGTTALVLGLKRN